MALVSYSDSSSTVQSGEPEEVKDLIICVFLLYIMDVPMPCVIPILSCVIRTSESDYTGKVCVLSGEGRSHFCRDTPCSIEMTACLYVPLANPELHLPMPHTAPQPCRFSMAEHVLPLAQLGQDCLNSNGYGESLRNMSMSAWKSACAMDEPASHSLEVLRKQITSWNWVEF